MRAKKKKSKLKKIALSAAMVAAAGASLLWVTVGNLKVQTPAYKVDKVIDGDSFYLTNGGQIRLANADAPEYNLCGGVEAKEGLEKLVLGKPVFIYTVTTDKYKRQISMVYTDEVFVNAEMLRRGFSQYNSGTKGYDKLLHDAVDEAREKGRGIHGPPCTQKINTANPSCNIKGNNNDDDKYYYPPDCPWYNQAFVQLFLGDQWFCSEQEAINAGYKKPPGCGK